MAMQWIWMLASAVCGYLLGSISTAILVGKVLTGEDIRRQGS